MQVYLLIAIGGIALVCYACYYIFVVLVHGASAIAGGIKAVDAKREERYARRAQAKTNAVLAAEQAELATFRQQNPVRIVGIPNADAYYRAFSVLHDFTLAANDHRPGLTGVSDRRFCDHKFPSHLVELPRPHPDSISTVEPLKFSITLDDCLMSNGTNIANFYRIANEPHLFPLERPRISIDAGIAPKLPPLSEPPRVPARLLFRDGTEVDAHSEHLRKAFEPELTKLTNLNAQSKSLLEEFDHRREVAAEALDLMNVYLANVALKMRDAQATLDAEYEKAKTAFEEERDEVMEPFRRTYNRYQSATPDGIRWHMVMALCALKLPLPDRYEWEVFYDPNERLFQLNQCVPATADITVKRADSNRPPAKRDAEAVLRRYIPAITLQLAHQISSNDLNDNIDTIAVNCWTRFFEPSSGRLKDAFVSALTVSKRDIGGMNLLRADALEAFRALKGAFVYSVQDVVPIEPQIRLDKDDDRFVAGRDVLDGMAQGQNLSAMDWQDFEHLIRELLSKEYASDTSEVKITRASRDRGVDAVVFNSDPLHGGKFVVQAKRYTNTVDVAAVRELYGTVVNEGANRGILVTTSHYGRDAYEWAANKPLTLIDGPNLLSLLSKHGYRFKIEDVRP